MKELLFVVVVATFVYCRLTAVQRLKRKAEMLNHVAKYIKRAPLVFAWGREVNSGHIAKESNCAETKRTRIFFSDMLEKIRQDLLKRVLPILENKVNIVASIAVFAAVMTAICFPGVVYASEPKAVTATVTSVPVDGEALNQYGETVEEEAERKALEAAQKEVVVSNNLKKAENQKVLVKKQKVHRKLRKKLSKTENAVNSMKKEKKSALSCLGAFQNTVLYSCVKNTYDSAISDKKSDLSEIKKEKKSVKNQMKSLKEEPKDIVFDPQDVTKESNISTEEMTKILEGTSLQKLAPTFVECEKKYGVNAIFLCSIAALESNWGNSRRAVEDNNYTGLGVYSDTAVGMNSDTPEGNIHATAQRLAENYLKEDGMFYNGLSVFAVNTKYCVGCTWGMKVTNIGYRLMDKVQADVSGAVME